MLTLLLAKKPIPTPRKPNPMTMPSFNYRSGYVYFIRLSVPLGNERHSARIYVGFAHSQDALVKRMKAHLQGRGAKFTRASVERGVGFSVIGVVRGNRDMERWIKNQRNHKKTFFTLARRGLTSCPSWLVQSVFELHRELGIVQ